MRPRRPGPGLASPARRLPRAPELPGLGDVARVHHVLGGAIDEQLLLRYGRYSEATPEGCEWLVGVARAAGLDWEILNRAVVMGMIWLRGREGCGATLINNARCTVNLYDDLASRVGDSRHDPLGPF